MKLIITTLLSLMVLQFVQAKYLSKSLPEKVNMYMQNNYPKATKIDWIKTNKQNYNTLYTRPTFIMINCLLLLKLPLKDKY